MDVVQVVTPSEAHLVRGCFIWPPFCRLFHLFQPGAQRFVDDLPERYAQPSSNLSRLFKHIVFNVYRRSHAIIIASQKMTSRHQMPGLPRIAWHLVGWGKFVLFRVDGTGYLPTEYLPDFCRCRNGRIRACLESRSALWLAGVRRAGKTVV